MADGTAVGCLLRPRRRVGLAVGYGEGCAVGALDALVGLAVGCGEGCTVGRLVKFKIGLLVGCQDNKHHARRILQPSADDEELHKVCQTKLTMVVHSN